VHTTAPFIAARCLTNYEIKQKKIKIMFIILDSGSDVEMIQVFWDVTPCRLVKSCSVKMAQYARKIVLVRGLLV
jgi:hypothetical protein